MNEQAIKGRDSARSAVFSYWIVGVIGIAISAAHLRWYVRGGPSGEIISGFGASLVVLGVLTGTWSVLRDGVRPIAKQLAHGPSHGTFAEAQAEADIVNRASEERITRDLVIERVVAIYIAVLGTVLNGYGPVIARGLHHLITLHATHAGVR